MTGEFTGERVIPGLVEPDLWNEHFARYAFARGFAAGKRVLDLGCGAGYGSAELAGVASSVTGIDIAAEALDYARTHFQAGHLRFQQSSCTQLPFDNASFDLAVCFEVIEHLKDWQALLSEARRVLAPGGLFVVSTPNKSFYAETRALTGPNPYHEHEFEYDEFARVLGALFPHVSMYAEDHVGAIAIYAASGAAGAETEIARTSAGIDEANFFLAVCSDAPQPARAPFLYVPAAANVLREKTTHIAQLEAQLQRQQADHAALLRAHEEQEAALLKSNQWATDLGAELELARTRIAALQDEIAAQHAAYKAQIAELNAALDERTAWARNLETQLASQTAELAKCVELLDRSEASLVERTEWAQSLDAQRQRLEAALAAVRSSRWMRVGRAVGLGPELERSGL